MMLRNSIKIVIAAFSLLIISCVNEKQKLQGEIAVAEEQLKNDSSNVVDKQKVANVIHLYSNFVEKFKDDSMSAEYLFRAADLTNGIQQPDKAIEMFGRVSEYQQYSKAPIALFLQGFIAETELKNLGMAKKYYEKFLAKYPNHEMADDVKITLSNIGKSPEDIIKEFEAKAKLDSAALQ